MLNLLSALEKAKAVIISGHTRPDGDCVGSCMALWHYIRDNYPDVHAQVRLESVPASYRLIPGTENIITNFDDDQTCDLFIALDASDKARLVGAARYFDAADHTICIDHHISNQGYADENLVCPQASSACEVLAGLLDMDRVSLNCAIALYTGIICDSGVFKYSSTSRRTMEIAGQLLEKGVPGQQLIDGVFYQKTYMQRKLLGRCLQDSFLSLDGRMFSCIVRWETMRLFGASHEDLEGVIDQLRMTEGVETAVLISEDETGTFKFSMRSNRQVDVSRICEVFGGGGHIRAAGFSVKADMPEVFGRVEAMVKEQLDACTTD